MWLQRWLVLPTGIADVDCGFLSMLPFWLHRGRVVFTVAIAVAARKSDSDIHAGEYGVAHRQPNAVPERQLESYHDPDAFNFCQSNSDTQQFIECVSVA